MKTYVIILKKMSEKQMNNLCLKHEKSIETRWELEKIGGDWFAGIKPTELQICTLDKKNIPLINKKYKNWLR